MTSEVSGDTKTNEFLHRRKLRLQQVREQSKDIAKQIRQRAKLEKFRQIVELDSKKQQEFLEKQNKLVKKLEQCYASGVESVGAGHKNAVEEKPHNENSDVINISKQRGKDAVAEIRRKKQEKLDNQKKILDRKLQAREAANEISREKVGASASRLTLISNVNIDKTKPDANKNDVSHNDMGTQWDVDELPEEGTPNIPTLSLPKDDTDSNNKESNNNIESKSDKSKRMDLFALSEEMPSSLRGGTGSDDKAPVKPSLTLISEYLQNRGLRLRETEKHSPNRNAELQKLRQTILCSRNPREGIDELCCVHDEEKYPVPVWQTITYCNYCYEKYYTPLYDKYKNPCKVHNIVKAKPKEFINPMPILKGHSPFKRDRISLRSCPIGNCGDRISSTQSSGQSRGIIKNSVTVYNHSTRDTRDIPCQDRGLVIRDEQNYEDAYSQAAKASTDKKKSEDAKKMQDFRSKVVMTKMGVEKEYKDTMNFLNSLPKNMGSKPMQEAYMDEHRQELRRETRQRKMQDEYHKIQKECKRQTCRNKTRNKSKSPTLEEEMYKDFQYSWMPVPESDSNLAIHTIPTALKESKSNNVKFSKVDSYHEYRSRHKHTPPTKEPIMIDIPKNMESERLVYSNSESDASEYSSDEQIRLQKRRSSKDSDLSEAEKVVIYKILQSKNKRTNQKLLKEIAKSLSLVDNSSEPLSSDKGAVRKNRPPSISVPKNKVSFDLKEGIYKTVSNNRISFNSMSCCQTNIELWRSTCERKPWWHDVSSMYYERRESDGTECIPNDANPMLCCKRKLSCGNHDKDAESPQWQSGDTPPSPKTGISNRSVHSKPTMETIMETATGSNCSYKTASTHSNAINKIPEDGFIKMIDECGHESGKFYIGASGFLKDKDYEVVIQLRKKGDEKRDKELRSDDMIKESVKHNTPVSTSEEKITEDQQTQPSSDGNETKKSVDSNTHQVFHPTIDFMINQNDDVAVSTPRKEHMNKQNSVPEPQPSFKSVAEKAVGTSFIDDYNIADHIPYSEPMEKPTTSAYAQTSESTPCNNRPMYFHMSSSTSTAYMSPPELILPNFLKKDMIKPRYSRDNGRDQFVSEKTSKPCICQKCIKSKRSCEFDDDYRERHSVNLKTPPNSARSPSSINSKDYDYNAGSNKELVNKKPCLKCRKCSSRKQLSTHVVKPSRCNIYAKYARNASKLGTSSTKPKNGFTNKKIKSTLNPLIKNYIIKLLDLNKGGLKAIQVMNQDCSAVTTPASSIINVQQNINNNRTNIENHISLERIKSMVVKQIMDEIKGFNRKSSSELGQSSLKNISIRSTKNKITRNKPKHKVKSLNIPKKITNTTKSLAKTQSPTSSFNNIQVKTKLNECKSKCNKGNSTPNIPKLKLSPIIKANKDEHPVHNKKDKNVSNEPNPNNGYNSSVPISTSMPINSHRATTTTSNSLEFEVPVKFQKNDIITNISTQTSNIDGELQFVKLAEDKIQNMEKIADLTEKCTQRLSNLAKVLDKVRKNKSLAYSQIVSENNSDSSDQKSDKADNSPRNYDINVEVQKLSETPLSEPREYNNQNKVDGDSNISPYLSNFERFLNDIPKPVTDNPLSSTQVSSTNSSKQSTSTSDDSDNFRGPKPPPALSRVHLRHLQTAVVPHELSTVIEVESPMSIKQKTLTSRSSRQESEDLVDRLTDENDFQTEDPKVVNTSTDVAPTTKDSEANTNEPSEETKHVMIDLKQFNEIMLKPFLSITEYAKHYDIGVLEEGSNLEDIVKDDLPNEDISSLHSDGSLPDVISELLKRNLIAEPFKFDTASNINSTTVSSDSTLSMLALSKVRKEKKKSSVMFQNKENIAETSDSLSMSSNPDLENAFKKLGMGWASSTLKKTKERLALSSSSNTSSSSMAQFKLRSFNQDVPALVTDNVSSVLNTSKQRQKRNATDSAKNAEQQTTMTNSMTVKEFLNNELAKRITFTNKSRNETEEEFVSLFETKMPEEMKHSSRMIREEGSIDNSMRSGNNRARTSTPVQLYKSMTYHSSSSSNVSNGLFSNLDEISSVKQTSNSMKHSTSDKDDLTIPNFSLKKKKCPSDCSKSD